MNNDLIDQFDRYLVHHAGLSSSSYVMYKKDMDLFIAFMHEGNHALEQYSHHAMLAFFSYLQQLTISYAHAKRIMAVLKLFYKYLYERHNQPDHASALTTFFQRFFAHFPLAISSEKLIALLKQYDYACSYKNLRDKVIIRLLYCHRLSINQLVELSIDQFSSDFTTLTIYTPKHKIYRLMLEDTQAIITYNNARKALVKQSEVTSFFPVKKGSSYVGLSKQAVWSLLKKMSKSTMQSQPIASSSEIMIELPEQHAYLQKHPRSH